ncbi:MAG: hypothetical protein LBG80_18150 [Bacteroidales bacterium]|jgi:heme/copper-type cytochrome/quinol oxidase subunit 2|nr:hypothetical protein [Bacteroidales bacterium]
MEILVIFLVIIVIWLFLFRNNNKSINQPNKASINLNDFCDILLSQPDTEILKILNIPLSKLRHVNPLPKDRKYGVISVYINDLLYNFEIFGIFNKIEYKIYRNGLIECGIYTTTNAVDKIVEISNVLFSKFGKCPNDNHSFENIEKIKNIANGNVYSENESCHNGWLFDNKIKVDLDYHVSPLRQFVLFISVRP